MIRDTWSYEGNSGEVYLRKDLGLDDVDIVKSHVLAYEDDLMCVLKSLQHDRIELPGGTVEDGESAISCLEREVWEEANIKIHNIQLLGVVEITYDNPHSVYGDKRFEAKFYADIKQVSSLTTDPAGGEYKRLFVEDIKDVDWFLKPFIKEMKVRDELFRLSKEYNSH